MHYKGHKMRNLHYDISPEHLELIIFPTEQCNFRCTYCYEDFLLGKMKSDTILGLKSLIAKRITSLKTLKLSWFGGEPLLAKVIILDIYEYIGALKKERNLSIQLFSHFTTNAYYLDLAFINTVASYGLVSFQISLDGYREVHDTTRKKINGSGTFDTIWRNLHLMRNSDAQFQTTLRLHLTPQNIDSMRILANKIKEYFLEDKRFTPYVMIVGDWGGPNKGNIEHLDQKKFIEYHKEITQNLLPDRSKVKNPFKNMPICYASKPNSLAIRADGRIAKCTVHLNDDRNTIGQLKTDGSINIDKNKMSLWMRGLESGEDSVLACPAKKMPKLPTNNSMNEIPITEVL